MPVILTQPAWRRATGPPAFSSLTPTEGKVLSPPPPEVPTCRKQVLRPPVPRLRVRSRCPLGPPASPSLVIAVRVKEEHVDMSTPDKASSPELPVSIENIKQETD